MGEKTASQVQDVVVAGSQSSNFLLPKENKSWSWGVPTLTMVGLCSQSGRPNKAFRGYCPFCWSAGTGADGRVWPYTRTHKQCGGQVLLYAWPWLGPRCSCWRWNDSKSILFSTPHSTSIRVYYCISGNSSTNKPCPIVMIVLISAV